MKLLDNIVRSGLSDTDDYQKKRGIILSNYISLLLSTAILMAFFGNLLFFGINIWDKLVLGLIFFLSPIVCNRLLLTNLSRLVLCFFPVFFLWYGFVSLMIDMPVVEVSVYDGLRIFLLAMCSIPYLLFDKGKLSMLIIGVIPTLVSVIFFDYILRLAGVGHEQFGLDTGDYTLMNMRTFIAYTIISGGCYAFHTIITQNDEFNKKILSELNKKSDEIKAQNEELSKSQSTLNLMNENLEELVGKKTQNIKRQNEVLTKYAYTNAHHVRGPVARILGLIYLSKIEKEVNYPLLFEKIENETNQIDNIIRSISSDLEEAES